MEGLTGLCESISDSRFIVNRPLLWRQQRPRLQVSTGTSMEKYGPKNHIPITHRWRKKRWMSNGNCLGGPCPRPMTPCACQEDPCRAASEAFNWSVVQNPDTAEDAQWSGSNYRLAPFGDALTEPNRTRPGHTPWKAPQGDRPWAKTSA